MGTEVVFPAGGPNSELPVLFAAAGSRAAPLHQFSLTGEDHLRVSIVGVNLESPRCLIAIRAWSENLKRLQVTEDRFIALLDGSVVVHTLPLDRGALLNLRLAIEPNAQVPYGACFVRAQIVRGLNPEATVLATILQGWVSQSNDLSWPGSPIQTTLDGRGEIAFIAFPANHDNQIELSVPQLQRWRPIAGSVLFTAGAVVGNRQLSLDVCDPGGRIVYHSFLATLIAAGSSQVVSLGAGLPRDETVPFALQFALPSDLELSAGWTMFITAANLQIGDMWSTTLGLNYRRWITG